MELRPLSTRELVTASELLLRTNHGQSLSALADDLAVSMRNWPSLQIGAFDENGALAGLIAGRIDARDPTIGYSDDIVVMDRFRAHGIGSTLLSRQIEAFGELGCHRVRGLSPSSLYGALPFFERYGFKVIRRFSAQGVWGIADGQEVCVTEKPLVSDESFR